MLARQSMIARSTAGLYVASASSNSVPALRRKRVLPPAVEVLR
jgi:hypothetical protein